MYFAKWAIFYLPTLIQTISLEIDGTIDLGPNWNYKYEMIPMKHSKKLKKTMRQMQENKEGIELCSDLNFTTRDATTKTTKDEDLVSHGVTKYVEDVKIHQIYDTPHKVRFDEQLDRFTAHVYKQNMKVFAEIRKKIYKDLQPQVDYLIRNYKEKFLEFLNQTRNENIKTRLGGQKVIFNTLITSNKILDRLVNYLVANMHKQGVLRNQAANVFQKEVNKEFQLEYKHVCRKFGICRSSNGFIEFLIEIITIIIKDKGTIFRQITDAFTEVLKEADFKKIMDSKTRKAYKRAIEKFETWSNPTTRSVLIIIKNVLIHRNQPIEVMEDTSDWVNKTVAFLEIVDAFDKTIKPNEANVLEWNDIKTSLEDFVQEKRGNILEIAQTLMNHIERKGIDKMDADTVENINDKFRIVFDVE